MSGLGTRAIVEINQVANQFQSSIVIKVGKRFIDVKSILGLSITLFSNEVYHLEIHGPERLWLSLPWSNYLLNMGFR